MRKFWIASGFLGMAVLLMGADFNCLRAQPGAEDTVDPSKIELPIPPEAPLPTPPEPIPPATPPDPCDQLSKDISRKQNECDEIREDYDDAVEDGESEAELSSIVSDHRACLKELEDLRNRRDKEC